MDTATRATMFSTGKDDWETPAALFDKLHAEFGFRVDVAANSGNRKVAEYFGPDHILPSRRDGLSMLWAGLGPCWCNPPYSRGLQPRFIVKAATDRFWGCTTVMLLPARTDTKVFHQHIWDEHAHRPRIGVEVRFLRGRLKFVGAPACAPFPSMVVVFRG